MLIKRMERSYWHTSLFWTLLYKKIRLIGLVSFVFFFC